MPTHHVLAGVLAFGNLRDPSSAWGESVGPAPVYWAITFGVVMAAVGIGVGGCRLLGVELSASVDGLASRRQLRRAAGTRALTRRGKVLRPSIDKPRPNDVGLRLGHASGTECWASVEDSLVVLGPPRSGKGLHLVVPAIVDAPGAVVTTSTRPDNLAATLTARERIGPVSVFDPQDLAVGLAARIRWSPVRGCESPQVAMARAATLCGDPAAGVDNASFWSQQCVLVVRCLLHAAALRSFGAAEVYRWSLSPLAAEEAADALRSDHRAAPGWAAALESVLAADPRQRDSVWAMVTNAFASLADPAVLDAVTPTDGEAFDPGGFLAQRGALFLLGTASGASACAGLVAALVEDVVETARRIAASSTGARLDPPLALVLDEAANYPLASLPSLMSEGGGSGIMTMVVLQSLAQARARWGRDEAAAIWDAAIVKLVLGGSGSAEDLRDLSALIGTREQQRVTHSWGGDGRRTSSTTVQDVPIMDIGRLRTLPFGRAVLLLRSAPPILLTMRPWTKRPDVARLRAGRADVEASLRSAANRRAA